MKLYGFGPTRSLRALWGLKELGAEFEFEVVNLLAGEHQRPEFLRLNPAGKLPVLVDGDLVITESAAIVLYLAEKYPQSKLLPADLKTRAQVYRWVMFAMTELEQPLWRITRHTALLPQDKRLPQDVALAREDFTRMATVLERHMAGRSLHRRRRPHGGRLRHGLSDGLGERAGPARGQAEPAGVSQADV